MKKTILAAVPLMLLVLAAPAAAHGGKRATTYKAKLAPTAGSAMRGKATLTDGKRRDRIRLRVRGLEAGASYSWSLRRAAAGGDACTGDEVAAFSYSALQGRRHGKAGSRSRGSGFAAGDGAYAVVVTDAEGEDVACFELKSKAQRRAERKKHDSADDESAADEDEQGDDDQGEDEDDLGEDDSAAGDDDPVEDDDAEDDV